MAVRLDGAALLSAETVTADAVPPRAAWRHSRSQGILFHLASFCYFSGL